jgi:hypothetical protein
MVGEQGLGLGSLGLTRAEQRTQHEHCDQALNEGIHAGILP